MKHEKPAALSCTFAMAIILSPNVVAEKVKMTGVELSERLGKYAVSAGRNPNDGGNWMIVQRPGGERTLIWHNFETHGVWEGTARVKGDQICSTYDGRPMEKCFDVYRLEDGSRQSYFDGKLDSYYRVIYISEKRWGDYPGLEKTLEKKE